jgi:hypothetical protein
MKAAVAARTPVLVSHLVMAPSRIQITAKKSELSYPFEIRNEDFSKREV